MLIDILLSLQERNHFHASFPDVTAGSPTVPTARSTAMFILATSRTSANSGAVTRVTPTPAPSESTWKPTAASPHFRKTTSPTTTASERKASRVQSPRNPALSSRHLVPVQITHPNRKSSPTLVLVSRPNLI